MQRDPLKKPITYIMIILQEKKDIGVESGWLGSTCVELRQLNIFN